MKKNTNKRSNVRKMTSAELQELVMEEAAKLTGELKPTEKVEAEEVDADGYADSIEHDLDIYKAMKIKEAKMRREYRKLVREARKVHKNKMIAKKRIIKKLK